MFDFSSSVFPSYCFSLYGGGAFVYRAYSSSMRWKFEWLEELELDRDELETGECVDGDGKEWYE